MKNPFPTGLPKHVISSEDLQKISLKDGQFHFDTDDGLKRIHGIFMCRILVERDNSLSDVPFLTISHNDKNMSVMCYTCMVENNKGKFDSNIFLLKFFSNVTIIFLSYLDACHHNDHDRSFVGTFCLNEVEYCLNLNMGYRLGWKLS